MPKVGNIEVKIGRHEHKYDVQFSQKRGFYISNFPKEVFSVTGVVSTAVDGHERMLDLEKSVRELLTEYYRRKETTRKVILYSLTFSREFAMQRKSINSWSGENPKFKIPKSPTSIFYSKEDTTGYGMTFNYHVAIEVDGSEKKYTRQWKDDNGNISMEEGSSRIQKDEVVIDWTPEREQFFENMKMAMSALALKFCDFFGQDRDKLLSVMDSGMKLLPSI